MANHDDVNLQVWVDRFETYLSQLEFEDKSHDIAHFRRVYSTANTLMEGLEVNPLVVLTACYFHDIVSYPKDHSDRSLSSRHAAEKTRKIIQEQWSDFPTDAIEATMHAIEAHSFSANITPTTLEAKIVQDADRMESLGAIGLARVFYTGGQMGAHLFHADDPLAKDRPLQEKVFSVDHFQEKLLRLPSLMQTEQGKQMAKENARFLTAFLGKLSRELDGDYSKIDSCVVGQLNEKFLL